MEKVKCVVCGKVFDKYASEEEFLARTQEDCYWDCDYFDWVCDDCGKTEKLV